MNISNPLSGLEFFDPPPQDTEWQLFDPFRIANLTKIFTIHSRFLKLNNFLAPQHSNCYLYFNLIKFLTPSQFLSALIDSDTHHQVISLCHYSKKCIISMAPRQTQADNWRFFQNHPAGEVGCFFSKHKLGLSWVLGVNIFRWHLPRKCWIVRKCLTLILFHTFL